MGMISGFHHVAMIVSSEESVKFYESLGFRESFRKGREFDTIVLLKGFGIELELFIDPRHPKRAESPENLGLRHMALTIDVSLEDCIINLKAKGVSDFGQIMTDWVGKRFCFVKDPDGIPVEIREV